MKRALALLLLLAAAPAGAQQAVNPIHPAFAPLAQDGQPARTPERFSADATCGACHDAKYVAAHSGHGEGRARATCVQCHVDGGRLDVAALRTEGKLGPDGRLVREALRIGKPRAANCQLCHGIVATTGAPVVLPEALLAAPEGGRTWSLTLGEGAIVSPQPMADSFLNLEGKAGLTSPWDVHAAKLVDCVACHHAGNDPARVDPKKAKLTYLTTDPRRPSTAEFLVRPDHRLAELDCRSCHDARKAHAFLPYRARHVEALACQACHLQAPAAPAAEMVDATVADAAGNPVIHFRNVTPAEGQPLNAAPLSSLRPLLLMRTTPGGARRLTPVNLVSRWRWTSRGEEVPFERVRQAFLADGEIPPALLAALDADRDGRLSTVERRLDAEPKVEAVAARLRALGVTEPRVEGQLEPHVLAHGVPSKERALRDCQACHAVDSRVAATYPLAAWVPGGVPPRPPDDTKLELAGAIEAGPGGGLVFRQAAGATPAGLHVLGHSRESWSNLLGLLVFLAVALGVTGHGLVRLGLRGRRAAAPHAAHGRREYVFGRYERLWHWTMAAAGVTLMGTGLVVHFAGAAPFSLSGAVALHNAAAVVLTVNAFLALFYHLATAAIRNFIPSPQGLLARMLSHMEYQARGIFFGGPHPENAPGVKLNPLQQLTYLGLLNVLFPLQIGSGALIWAVGTWPALGAGLGGLSILAPLHNLGSWLFLAFFVLHVYLVTTGRTVGDHLQSMVTGYRTLDTEPESSPGLVPEPRNTGA